MPLGLHSPLSPTFSATRFGNDDAPGVVAKGHTDEGLPVLRGRDPRRRYRLQALQTLTRGETSISGRRVLDGDCCNGVHLRSSVL